MLRKKRTRVSILIASVVAFTFLAPVSGEAGSWARSGGEGLWGSALSWLGEVWKGLPSASGAAAREEGTGSAPASPRVVDTTLGKPVDAKPSRGSAIDPNGSL